MARLFIRVASDLYINQNKKMESNVGLGIFVLQLTVSYIMAPTYENGGFKMRNNIKGVCKIYHEEGGWGMDFN